MEVKVGDKIRVIYMYGEPRMADVEGVVCHIDDIGQIHCREFGLAVVPDLDKFEVIESV